MKLAARQNDGSFVIDSDWFEDTSPGKVMLRLEVNDAIFVLRYCNWTKIFSQYKAEERKHLLCFIQHLNSGKLYMGINKSSLSFQIVKTSARVAIDALLRDWVDLLNILKQDWISFQKMSAIQNSSIVPINLQNQDSIVETTSCYPLNSI